MRIERYRAIAIVFVFAMLPFAPLQAQTGDAPSEVDFHVTLQEHKAALLWTFYGQLSAYGFTVERRDGLGEQWKELSFVNQGLCVEGACSYQYTDYELPAGVDGVYYRIKVLTGPDNGWYTRDVLLQISSIQPEEVSLLQNYPNPVFTGTADATTSIRFRLPEAMHVVLEVYTATGQRVETLANEYKPRGTYTEQFQANNLPAGVYFYRISTPQTQIVKRMIVQK